MRLLPAIAFLCVAGARAGEPLLILVDETLREPLAETLAAWTAQIATEGRFVPVIEEVPRGGDEARRLANLALMRARIEALQPAAVQLVGHLDWGISGWANPDGHEFRAVATDAPLMDATFVGTDLVDHGATGLRPNLAGDGRWDQQWLREITRPVARIDLGGIEGSLTNSPAYQFREGCLQGQPICPAVAEVSALRDYFRRNLAYRTGAWRPPRVAYMVGPLWDLIQPDLTLARMPQFEWVRSTTSSVAAGREAMLLWCNAATTELSELRREPDCAMVQPFWVNTYRSYGMEVLDGCGTLRSWLQWALVSSWGGHWWGVPPGAGTVADAIRATAVERATGWGWDVLYQVLGDVTLPLEVPENPPVVVAGGVTSIRIVASGGAYPALPTAEIALDPAPAPGPAAPAGARVASEAVTGIGRVVLTLRLVSGESYLLEGSPDLVNWSLVFPVVGVDQEAVDQELIVARPGCYFRVRQLR